MFCNIRITTKSIIYNKLAIERSKIMKKVLKIEKIEKYYGNRSSLTKAIDNISFEVEEGEFVAIMGASGSGKTTLLNCISTIDKVTSGHIYVNDQDVTKLKGNDLNKFRREELGFVFQDFNLLDTLTAYENIALALSIQNRSIPEIEGRIKMVAKELNIEKLNPIIRKCEDKIIEIKDIIKDFDYSDKKTYEELTSKVENDLKELENIKNVNKINEIIDEINKIYRNAYNKKNNVSSLSYIMETDENIDLINKIDIENLE